MQNLQGTWVKMINPSFRRFGQYAPKRFIWKLESEQSGDTTVEGFSDFQVLANASSKVVVSDVSTANRISAADMHKILQEIMDDRKCSKEEAFSALALLAQMGATSARTNDKVQIKVNSTTFNYDLIKRTIKKFTGKNLRRLAKTFATEFHIVAENKNSIGNLYNKIIFHYPNFKVAVDADKYWMSDFQSENEKCPSYIRDILSKYYNEHIQPNNNSIPKKKK